MREDIELKVHLAFDEDAAVWYVRESDVPGLRLESADPMELVRRIADNVAELIELNADEVRARTTKRDAKPSVRFTPIFDDSMPAAAFA